MNFLIIKIGEKHEYAAFQEYVKKNDISYEYIAYNCKHDQVAIKIL